MTPKRTLPGTASASSMAARLADCGPERIDMRQPAYDLRPDRRPIGRSVTSARSDRPVRQTGHTQPLAPVRMIIAS